MIRLLNLLIYGYSCEHKWEIMSQGPIEGDRPGLISGRYYNLRCRKCGDVKCRNLT